VWFFRWDFDLATWFITKTGTQSSNWNINALFESAKDTEKFIVFIKWNGTNISRIMKDRKKNMANHVWNFLLRLESTSKWGYFTLVWLFCSFLLLLLMMIFMGFVFSDFFGISCFIWDWRVLQNYMWILTVWRRKILTVWKGNFWQFEKGNFWQFGKEIFDSLKRKFLTVWKRKFLTVWKRKFLTVWKGNFWQFGKEIFDSLERKFLTVWKGNFWQFEKGKFCHIKFSLKNSQSKALQSPTPKINSNHRVPSN
jgi:hypothetical protein